MAKEGLQPSQDLTFKFKSKNMRPLCLWGYVSKDRACGHMLKLCQPTLLSGHLFSCDSQIRPCPIKIVCNKLFTITSIAPYLGLLTNKPRGGFCCSSNKTVLSPQQYHLTYEVGA